MGDLNHDGAPDMVVADAGSNDVAVFLNSGGGSFPASTTYATGTQPSAIALGDVNGDGKLDIVVADAGSNDVSVLLNNGNGTFPASATKYGVGHAPSAIALLDYNGDGKLDIVVANSGDNTVMVLLGNGNGTFQAPITIATGTGPNGLAVGNLTGGGNGDMVVTNGNSGSVSVLLNAAAVIMGGASAGPTMFGLPATLTATVTPAVKSTRLPTGTVTFTSGGVTLGHAALSNQGTSTFTTKSLGTGLNTITFTYSGDNFFNTQTGSLFQLVTKGAPPNVLLTPSANPGTFGQPVVLKATVSAQAGVGVPSGTVSFTDSVQGPLGTAALNGTGVGALSVSTLTAGTHSIVASYSGDANFADATSSALMETINQQTTTTTLTATANPAFFNQTVTFAAHVSATRVPTGTVTFNDGATSLGSAVLTPFGDVQITVPVLSVGAHNITAQYSGDPNSKVSSAALNETVNKAPITLEIVSSANPSTVAAPAQFTATITGLYGGAASGAIQFNDGATSLASVNLTGNSAALQPSLSAGVHTIRVTYAGDADFLGSSDGVVQVVNNGGAATTLTVSASANPVYFNRDPAKQQVTLTASVSSATAGTPTGTITFLDDDQVLTTATLGTSGCPGGAAACATFTTDQFTIGAHHIIAVYGGDGTFGGTVSPAVELDRSPRFKR
jgi:hypothetical protein